MLGSLSKTRLLHISHRQHRVPYFLTRRMVSVLIRPIQIHYHDVTMSPMAPQITSLSIVCSTVYSGADQRKHQSSASLAFVRGIHRLPANSSHKGPVTRKMFPFDDVILCLQHNLNRHPITQPWVSCVSSTFGLSHMSVFDLWSTLPRSNK